MEQKLSLVQIIKWYLCSFYIKVLESQLMSNTSPKKLEVKNIDDLVTFMV